MHVHVCMCVCSRKKVISKKEKEKKRWNEWRERNNKMKTATTPCICIYTYMRIYRCESKWDKEQAGEKSVQKKKKVMKGKIIACVLHMYIFFACVRASVCVCVSSFLCGMKILLLRLWIYGGGKWPRTHILRCKLRSPCIMYMKLITGTSIVFYHLYRQRKMWRAK